MARLRRSDTGDIILPSGEKITKREYRHFRYIVAKANANREELINYLPPIRRNAYRLGRETDFITTEKIATLYNYDKKTKARTSLRFSNRKEFLSYSRSVQHLADPSYKYHYTEIYRENYIQALEKTFGASAQEIVDFVESLDAEDWRKIALDDTLSNIGYVYYENEEETAKLEQLQKGIVKLAGTAKDLAKTKRTAKIRGGMYVKIHV